MVLLVLLLTLQAVLRAGDTAAELAVQPSPSVAPAASAIPGTPGDASPPPVPLGTPPPAPPPLTAPPLAAPPLSAPPPSLGTPAAVPAPAPAPSFAPPPPVPATTARQPGASDAAAFLAAHPPAQGPERDGAPRSVVADLNSDGADEVLVASLRDGSGVLEVASWDGTGYRVVFASSTGAAQRLLELRVADVAGDARPEVGVRTGIGEDPALGGTGPTGERLALFGSVGERFGPSVGVGGCWDSSFVYGATGAVIAGGELRATCPPDPATGAPRTDVYVFDGTAWTLVRTEGA